MTNPMRKLTSLGFICVILLALVAGSISLQAAEETPQQDSSISSQEHLVILHVNDTHGHLDPRTVKKRSVGGIARLATMVKQIRQENPNRVLLLHAGDAFSRGDTVTSYYGGAANFDLMNRVGFDAMVLGNGDYYFGLENLHQQIPQAKFTVLAGNVFQTSGAKPQPVGKDFLVKNVGPLRVGLLGLSFIRPEHPSSRNLKTGNNMELARDWLAKMNGQTDLVVLLSHQGLPADMMLAGMLSGVHIVVGGHTHSVLAEPIVIRKPSGSPDKTYIVQAGEYYSHLGRIDLTFTRSPDNSWQVTDVSSQLIPIGEPVVADEKIAKRLAQYKHSLTEVVYKSDVSIPAHGTGTNTVAKLALKAVSQEFPGCLVVLDRGAIRANIPKGNLTRARITRIHPWRNQLLKTTITSTQLSQALAEPGLLWYGVEFQRNDNQISNVKINGSPVAENQQIPLVLGEYVLNKSATLSKLPCQDTHGRLDALLEAHLRQLNQAAQPIP